MNLYPWACLLVLTVLLHGCGGGAGVSGSSMTISACMDPAGVDARDIQRNLNAIRNARLCYRRQQVREGPFRWVFHILEHPKAPKGPFWVLPHDNENTAFDAAVYAVATYGGGLLAVDSGGRRHFLGQDPNRNFSSSRAESRLCRDQRLPAPGYTAAVLNHYKGRRGPYLALHNNYDGWQGNGGRGTISLYRETRSSRGFPAQHADAQLRDEDNLVFIAGPRALSADSAVRRRISALNAVGLNVVYKRVDRRSFDCSLSDYIARHAVGEYYNIEAEYGQRQAQQQMIDRLMQALGIQPLRRAPVSPFLGG
ncbi:MAG: hypothetical protein N838_11570 [Thiohalocapsa sp. PB-PSB1]|nr:MAG: hypothetical protein N838_11570 [Thiohalocapsa sp. PB-PSB1]